jgi:hypothetical protein
MPLAWGERIGDLHGVNLADVWMVQGGDHVGVALEALRELLRRDFNRDVAAQASRAIHFAHPAFADGRDDFARTEFFAGSDRHLGARAKFSRSES